MGEITPVSLATVNGKMFRAVALRGAAMSA